MSYIIYVKNMTLSINKFSIPTITITIFGEFVEKRSQ